MPKILAVETSRPAHEYSQKDIRKASMRFFGPLMRRESRAAIFDRSGVQNRRLAEPLSYYFSKPDFKTRNADYLRHALTLARRAITGCLKKTGTNCGRVTHIFSVTTTGLATPSLEAHLSQSMPFSRNVKRTPIFGVGCAGGVVGLARAFEYLKGHPKETVLLLSTELCSLTFLPREQSMTQLVAAALFGDGCGAALLAGDAVKTNKHPFEIIDAQSELLPDSLDIMGWNFTNEGPLLMLSPRAPAAVQKHLRPAVDRFLNKHRLEICDISSFLLHPGSAKILDACEGSLGLAPGTARISREILRKFANMSSASILFILKEAIKKNGKPGKYSLLAGLGPGFACENVLLRSA
ncbi:MAG: type III polyketide synthase [Elusimicrobiota bacterium]